MPPMKPTRGRAMPVRSAGSAPPRRAGGHEPLQLDAVRDEHLCPPVGGLLGHEVRGGVDDEVGARPEARDLRLDVRRVGIGERLEAVGPLQHEAGVRQLLGERRAGRAVHPQHRIADADARHREPDLRTERPARQLLPGRTRDRERRENPEAVLDVRKAAREALHLAA